MGLHEDRAIDSKDVDIVAVDDTIAPDRPNHGRSRKAAALPQLVAAPPGVGESGYASGSVRRPATRPNGEELTTMVDLDPAAGAMPGSGEKSLAQPSGGRRRGRPKGSGNKAAQCERRASLPARL